MNAPFVPANAVEGKLSAAECTRLRELYTEGRASGIETEDWGAHVGCTRDDLHKAAAGQLTRFYDYLRRMLEAGELPPRRELDVVSSKVGAASGNPSSEQTINLSPAPSVSADGLPADRFQRLSELGFGSRLLPIAQPGVPVSEKSLLVGRVGKIPSVRKPNGEWIGFSKWTSHVSTQDDAEQWAAWGAGVGLLLGDGLCAIDCDAQAPEAAALLERRAAALGLSEYREGQAPKKVFLLRTEPGAAGKRRLVTFKGLGGKPEQIELRAGGQQVVICGTHPKTSRPYEWHGVGGVSLLPSVAFGDLPAITEAKLDELFAELARELPEARLQEATKDKAPNGGFPDQRSLVGDPEIVGAAVAAIPNDYDRIEWLGIMRSIKAACAGDMPLALDLCQEFSSRCPKGDWNDAYVEMQFHTLAAPHGSGAKRLYEIAVQRSSGEFTQKMADDANEADANTYARIFFSEEDDASIAATEAAASRDAVIAQIAAECGAKGYDAEAINAEIAAYDAERAKEAALWAPTSTIKFKAVLGGDAAPVINGNWTVKKVLPRVGLGVQYGAPGSGKTFSAMDLALHVSAPGLSQWRGHRIKTGGVAYIACEGGNLTQNRVAAWRDKHGDPGNFALYPYTPDLSSATSSDVAQICHDIKDQQGEVVLVVVDTLAKAMKGADENSGVDMGKFIAACEQIRTALNCFVLIVHHSGKDVGKGSRGHSSLLGAIDLEIEVKRLEDETRGAHAMKITKLRDGEAGAVFWFRLKAIDVGVDEDGDKVTTCLVEAADGVSRKERASDEKQRVLIALSEDGKLSQRDLAVELGTTRQKVSAHVKDLCAEKWLRKVRSGPGYVLTPAGEAHVKAISTAIFDVIDGEDGD